MVAGLCAAAILPVSAAPPDKSSVKASKISLPSGPGSIEGLGESFEPQLNTGASSYGVKISLPPGRAGLQPSVRLAYNSGLGNSILGIGWTMEFPCIKRQTDKGFPHYDSSDTFVFGGEELVPLNNAERDWRCENESAFQRLRQIDSNADGLPDAWEATDKDGTRHLFGQYRGTGNPARWSAIVHPGAPAGPSNPQANAYCWMLDTTIDLHGNRIDYEYTSGTGVLYPSRITYSQLGTHKHEVTFAYEPRSDAFDDYRPTFSARIDKRLTGITVWSDSALVRSYALAYNYASGDLAMLTAAEVAGRNGALDTGVSILKKITQQDRSGVAANYLPPLVFAYSTMNPGAAALRTAAQPPTLDLSEPGGNVQIADINGDGLPDIFSSTPGGATQYQEVCLNRGESPSAPTREVSFDPATIVEPLSGVSLSAPESTLADLDADGLTDYAILEDSIPGKVLKIFHNKSRLDSWDETRLGFQPDSVPEEQEEIPDAPDYLSFHDPATRQIDLNFDKVSDFLHPVSAFLVNELEASYRDESGTWIHASWPGPDGLPGDFLFSDTSTTPPQSNPRAQLADLNGDRLTDLVYLETSGGVAQTLTVTYWPMCSLGKWAAGRIMGTTAPDAFQLTVSDLRDVYVQDFTGDGLADILEMDNSSSNARAILRINIAGQRWSQPYTFTDLPRYDPRDPANPTIFRTADLNGNGSTDLIFLNNGIGGGFQYLELMPQGKPNLMAKIDNSLGKVTSIIYGEATDDMIRAWEAGAPWQTKCPFPMPVVRQIRTSCGYDLNGDGKTDTAVAEFRYRDAFYDSFEKEFRGFAFAERIDYGDDKVWDPALQRMAVSGTFNIAQTPTGQVSGPSLITRYRFHTGAADRQDNDVYPTASPPEKRTDEISLKGGREEEILKGRQLVEEKIDPRILHSSCLAPFDKNCFDAARSLTATGPFTLTPDAYVYTRSHQDWTVRRLYRPVAAEPYYADQDRDGVLEYYAPPNATVTPPVPAGRFAPAGIAVRPGSGRSVSFAFVSKVETQVLEANGTLATSTITPAPPVRASQLTRKTFDQDDYGNETLEFDEGFVDGTVDDERKTITTYALGGEALTRWIIGLPDNVSVTDENGIFVSRAKHYYDGSPFTGLASGQVGARALLHRTQEFKTATTAIEATRTRYDGYGNPVELRDPIGNTRSVAYDAAFQIYPTTETIVVGGGNPDLTVSATYDTGFGTVTSSTDFNGNRTEYQYDSFARLVKIIRPGDTLASPTLAFEYQPADPTRSQLYSYDPAGNLTILAAPSRSASRVLTRRREIAGGSEFITASFTDGCGKKLGTVEEGANTGTWIVKAATRYNLRGSAQSTWLPYQISAAAVPQFGEFWTAAGRPPLTDGYLRSTETTSATLTATDHFYDPTGREIRSVNPPETWAAAAPRKFTAVQYLPFEERHFDEEDTDPASPHTGTPMVHYMDGLGRLTGVDEVVKTTDTGDPGPLAAWQTRYLYDLNDQLRRITDSQGNVKTMEFDGLKRMTGMNDPDRGVMTFLYDDASNLKETLDAKAQRIAYTYDGANRIKTEDYQDGGPRVLDVEYFYDTPFPGGLAVGDLLPAVAENTKGQLAFVRDLSGETHFSYDTRARVTSEIKRIPDRLTGQLVNFRTRFGYDSADRLQTLTYPDGDQLQHAYNPRNLLTRLYGATLGDIVQSITYQPSGQLSAISYGNTVATAYQYDPRLRLKNLNTAKAAVSPAFVSFDYTFDGASNITRIDDRRDLTAALKAAERFNTQSFTYDSLYRLTRVDYPGLGVGAAARFVEYRYDRIGNMLRQTSDLTHQENGLPVADLGTMSSGGTPGRTNRQGRAAADPPGPHALTKISRAGTPDRTYDYDPNGNMKVIDGLTCTWDFKDRLIVAENATMRATYTYDYTDRRITKTVVEKLPSTPGRGAGGEGLFTAYVNKYYELREGDSPVKYVWNGDTRVARVTATFSSALHTQHLRLHQGWNLVCLTVGGPQPKLDSATNPTVPAALLWSATTPGNGYTALTGTTPIPAGSTAWIWSTTAQTLLLTGTAPPANLTVLTGTGQFLGNLLPERLDLATAFPASAWLTRYQSAATDGLTTPGTWLHRFPAGHDLAPLSDAPAWLNPGEALWTTQGTPGPLNLPAAALAIRYYHQDHLGSTSVITDQSGSLIEETTNYAFGHPRNSYKPGPVFPEAYGFTQKERDKESGLHYFKSRYYVAALGRFPSVDRMVIGKKWQWPYAYSTLNPVRFEEFLGMGPLDRVASARAQKDIPYKQESDPVMRTQDSKDALANMDCSEFVTRVLVKDSQMPEGSSHDTKSLQKVLSDTKKWTKSDTPEPGDVALWKGHTGIVGEANKAGEIKLIHARGAGKLSGENKYAIPPQKYRDGFIGYYRPTKENDPATKEPSPQPNSKPPETSGSPTDVPSQSEPAPEQNASSSEPQAQEIQ